MFRLLSLLFVIVISKNKLKINKFNKFRVLHLTDFHFGEGVSDEYNVDGIYNILRFTKPDFVVVTGDLVSGYSYKGGQSFFQDGHTKFVQPFRDLKIPYLLTLGNHDDEANMNREQIMDYDKQEEQSYSMDYPFHSTNYYVPIYYNDESKEILRIWAFDTNDSGCDGHSGSWGCIEQEVVDKFREMNQESIYGMAVMHIPPPEFITMYGYQQTFGVLGDYVACPLKNTGVVDAILEKDTIQLLLVGHNHNNDYGGRWPNLQSNLTLMYGRKSGYGGYRLCCNRFMGGRVIDYVQKGSKLSYTQHIVDYTNTTRVQSANYHTPVQVQCSLNQGPTWQAYKTVGFMITLYFILTLFTLCLILQRHYDQIYQVKQTQTGESLLQN